MKTDTAERMFWMTMLYQCDRCRHTVTFYLEDGCEGPKDRREPISSVPEWVEARKRAPAAIRSRLPDTVPVTASGRVVLPVPFVAGGCPRCQGPPPWDLGAGTLQHAMWDRDEVLPEPLPLSGLPERQPHFRYPDDPTAAHACGIPTVPWDPRRN